jgi:DNA ligase D-like protein (predicted ligase)
MGEIPESIDDSVESLPDFVEPMLARLEKRPFDSNEHLFEIKWDGIRALTFVENGAHRMLSRRRNDMTDRYPDLAFLAGLPAGTLLDGELVVLRDGRPDFRAVMSREQARGSLKIQNLVQTHPASYVVFDVLYLDHHPVMQRPLTARRELLRDLVESTGNARLVLSEGVVGQGVHTFEQMRAMGLEGMVAKHLDSAYMAGARTDAWIKVKTTEQIHCVILGYAQDDTGGLKSLIIGTEQDGALRCIGKVGSGLSEAERGRLRERLDASRRERPLVETSEEGVWVEPELFCLVSYHERTPDGNLRAPVFEGLVTDG